MDQKTEAEIAALRLEAEAEELKELKAAILVFRRCVDNYGVMPRAGNSGHSKKMQDAVINASSHFQRAIDDGERKNNPRRPWWWRVQDEMAAEKELEDFEDLLAAYGDDEEDEPVGWEKEIQEIPE